MKKRILLFTVVLMFIVTSNSFSQIRFGGVAGLDFARFSYLGNNSSDFSTPDSSSITANSGVTSFHFGPMLEFSLADPFYLETGLIFCGRGGEQTHTYTSTIVDSFFGLTTVSTSVSDVKYTPLYIQIPIIEKVKFNVGSADIDFLVGTYFSFGIAGKYNISSTGTTVVTGGPSPQTTTVSSSASGDIKFGSDSTSMMKSIDFGLSIGAGVEYQNFLFRLQYIFGTTNINNANDANSGFRHSVFTISAGYIVGNAGGKHHHHRRR